MNDGVLSFLERARKRLNRVIILYRAIVWLAPGALASGVFVAALRVCGIGSAGLELWAGLCVAAAAAGAIAARSALLDERGAARWLDARLGANELVSASLACARRHETGRFDAEILERTAELAPKAAALRPPAMILVKQGILTVAAVALGAGAILLSSPYNSAAIGRGVIGRGATERRMSAESLAETAAEAIGEGGQAAAAFAASLFPDDKRLAKLTERALREGRVDDLRDLMETAGLQIDSELARAPTEPERRKLSSDQDRLERMMAALDAAQDAQSGAGGAGGDQGGEDGRQTEGNDRPAGKGQPAPDDGSAKEKQLGGGEQPGDGLRSGSDAEENGAPEASDAVVPGLGGDAAGGGPEAGFGSGRAGSGESVEAEATGGEAAIARSPGAAFFELILPGESAVTPISAIVASSRRSAESAMSREALPLEYEDFVKSYFMALSQGDER